MTSILIEATVNISFPKGPLRVYIGVAFVDCIARNITLSMEPNSTE